MGNRISSLDEFVGLCDSLADEFIEAAVKDLSHPETRAMIREAIDTRASRVLGVNVNAPFVKPFWDKAGEIVTGNVIDFLGLAICSPPDSVDAATDVIKETITSAHEKTDAKIDSLSEKLKQRLAEKESAKS